MEPAATPPPASAPPTIAPAPSAPETSWPTVLGVIGIVLGIFGALGGCAGVAMSFLFPQYIDLFGDAMPPEMKDAMQASMPHPALSATLQGLVLLAAILLIVAGVGLTKRRRSGATMLRRWAVFKIVLVVVNSVVGAFVALSQADAMEAAGAGQMPPGMQSAMTIVSIGFGLLWGLALPVFSLVWLGRGKIRAEVARWDP